MSELNFSFPTVLNIRATRKRHKARMEKLISPGWFSGTGEINFLNTYSDDDLFELIYHKHRLWLHAQAEQTSGQRLVKAVKTAVNQEVRFLITNHLIDNNITGSWDTAYYLVHQKAIDAKMERVSRMIFDELVQVYYQPELNEDEWGDKLYSFEVYRSLENAQEDFPGRKINKYQGNDIEEPTFVD